MSTNPIPRPALAYAALVGTMDFATGVGLLAVPATTLALMGAAVPAPGGIAYLRFVGVFVAAVGANYLWAAASRNRATFHATLVSTIFYRGGAGLFAAVAVSQAVFDPAWLVVAATDLACVGVQGWLLAKGGWYHE